MSAGKRWFRIVQLPVDGMEALFGSVQPTGYGTLFLNREMVWFRKGGMETMKKREEKNGEERITAVKEKRMAFIELAGYVLFMVWCTYVVSLIDTGGLLLGALAYFFQLAVTVFWVVKADKQRLCDIGLKKPVFWDIPKGLLLGCCMFAAQQIPLLLMGMDYSAFAMAPDRGFMIGMSLYCFLCVGVVEELMFRGFILHKTQALCKSRVVCVGMNGLLFYAVHLFPLRFVFGEFYSIAVNTVLLCLYFYKSKNKSLVSLMIAHGFYDVLTSVALPVFVFWQ